MSSNNNRPTSDSYNPKVKVDPNKNDAGYTHYVVQGDRIRNNVQNYDTMIEIAREWLRLNPDVKKLPAVAGAPGMELNLYGKNGKPLSLTTRLERLQEWMGEVNNLKYKTINVCDENGVYHKMRLFFIHPGMELDLPMGTEVRNPRQAQSPCSKGAGVDCAPAPTPTPEPEPEPLLTMPGPEPKPEPKTPEYTPHYYTRMSSPATDGKQYKPGTMDHALQTAARTGLFPEFTYNYYQLANITPRNQLRNAKDSGQVGTSDGIGGDHLMEGKHTIGESRESRKDNEAARRWGTTGRKFMNAPRGRTYFPGEIEEVTADGSYIRSNQFTFAQVRSSHEAAATFFGQVVNLGPVSKLPIKYGAGTPNHEEVLESSTRRWGLSQVDYVMAKVNLGGKSNMFVNQQAVISAPFESPDRIYGALFLRNAQNELVTSMQAVDAATTPEDKQAAATRALTAYRDFSDNFLVKGTDAMAIPVKQSGDALRDYLRNQKGVDVDAIDKDLYDFAKTPRLGLKDMAQEQLESQLDYKVARGSKSAEKDKDGKFSKGRYSSIQPGQTNDALKAAERFAYPIMNKVELDLARNNFVDKDEAAMGADSAQAWQLITKNPDNSVNTNAITAFGKFVEKDSNAAVEIGQTLRDVWNHPEFYTKADGSKLTSKEAKELVKSFIGEEKIKDETGKEIDNPVYADITIRGNTSPVPYMRDQSLPIAHPDLIGPAVGKAIQANPEKFAELMGTVTGAEDNKKGKSDGRRYGIALLRTLGAERMATGNDGDEAPGLHSVLEAIPNPGQEKENPNAALVRSAVVNAAAYAEKGASGRSLRGAVHLDNTYVEAQQNAQFGNGVDLNQTYQNLFMDGTARDLKADQVAVEGLKNNEQLSTDVVIATLLRNPQALQGAEDGLRSYSRSSKAKLQSYDELHAVMRRTRKAAEDYQEALSDGKNPERAKEKLDKAVQKLGDFFMRREDRSDSSREGVLNKARQEVTAWEGMMGIIADDPTMSRELLTTMARDSRFRDEFIKAVPETVFADSMRHSMVPDDHIPQFQSDTGYQSRFFTFKTDKSGKVDAWNSWGLGRNHVTVNRDEVLNAVEGNTGMEGARAAQEAVTIANQRANEAAILAVEGDKKAPTLSLGKGGSVEQDGKPLDNVLIKSVLNADGTVQDLVLKNNGKVDAKETAKNLPHAADQGLDVKRDAQGAIDWKATNAANPLAQTVTLNENGSVNLTNLHTGIEKPAPAANLTTSTAAQNITGADGLNDQARAAVQSLNLGHLAVTTNNPLQINPVVLGENTQQSHQAALAGWLQNQVNLNPQLKHDKSLNTPEAIANAAQTMIDQNMVTVHQQAGQLVATPEQSNINATFAMGGMLGQGQIGLNTNLLLLFILPFIKTHTGVPPEVPDVPLEEIPYEPCDCPEDVGEMAVQTVGSIVNVTGKGR